MRSRHYLDESKAICTSVIMTAILNYQLPIRSDSIGSKSIELVDLKQVGITIAAEIEL